MSMTKTKEETVKDHNIIISLSGTHPGKSVLASIIANALSESGINNITHTDFDDKNFSIMREAVSESKTENNLHDVNALIVEWNELELDEMAIESNYETTSETISESHTKEKSSEESISELEKILNDETEKE